MSQQLSIWSGQQDFRVGALDENTQKIIHLGQLAAEQGADIVVFPELTITGYPPEDLLLRESIQIRVEQELKLILDANIDTHLVIGYPKQMDGQLYNMAGIIYRGKILAEYAKQCLPNYEVFDEVRYFKAGDQPLVINIKGVPTAVTICEDIWEEGPMSQAKAAGAKLMLNLNASPFHIDKPNHRLKLLSERALQGEMPIVYTNLVGGQDELVFDGGSMVVDQAGNLKSRSQTYVESFDSVVMEFDSNNQVQSISGQVTDERPRLEAIYQTLVLGVKDYVNKNGFKGILLGLSGGIDSALTLAIAADAIGKDRVEAVMMPFKYTSQMSLQDAEEEALALGVSYKVLPIESMYHAFMDTLADEFEGTDRDTTEENLQARCRGVMLMALSNKKGYMVLTTGNKSEMAVGYATLYGDMVGGYSALKDVFKQLVFELSEYRNTLDYVIPQRVIDRPPSAELSPDQKDEDSLPPYPVLDAILSHYIEEDWSAQKIIDAGFEDEVVRKVIRLVDLNEYKRRQAPVGVRLTQKGFGRDRRYPITNGWKAGI